MSETINNFNKLPKNGKIFFLLIIAGFAWWIFAPESKNDDNEQKIKYSKNQALVMSESFVKDNLKSPSTAEFSSDFNNDVTQLNDSTFEVKSWVDSQNGFGAMLRSNYSCKITFANNKANCSELVIN